jgi:hypothetical protein
MADFFLRKDEVSTKGSTPISLKWTWCGGSLRLATAGRVAASAGTHVNGGGEVSFAQVNCTEFCHPEGVGHGLRSQ